MIRIVRADELAAWLALAEAQDAQDLRSAVDPGILSALIKEVQASREIAPTNVLKFPTGRRGVRAAQIVYDEMRKLAAELREITGHPVSMSCQGEIDPAPNPRGAA